MAKIGIFGGSFDPPHLGHILALQEFKRKLNLDLVLVIPAKDPPHKELARGGAAAEHRLEMIRLAISDLPGVEVSDLELRRAGKSYTADTVEQLRVLYPEDTFYLLMGTDMFLSFSAWFEPQRITAQATLVAAYRTEDKGGRLAACAQRLKEELNAQCILLENDYLPCSSTGTRAMLAFGCADDYLPGSVYDYICRNQLYFSHADLQKLDFDRLKSVSLSLHDRKRVPHVIGCSDTAMALANVYGANHEDARRAGILHDITKALNAQEQLKLCESYGIILDKFYRENPKLLHAKTGAAVAQRVFGENEAVCQAICWHTTGKPEMNLLEKILYLADYVEPNRSFDTVESLRALTFEDIDAAMCLGLQMTMDQLRGQERQIDPNSLAALRFYQERNYNP